MTLHAIYVQKAHLVITLLFGRNFMKTPYCIYRLRNPAQFLTPLKPSRGGGYVKGEGIRTPSATMSNHRCSYVGIQNINTASPSIKGRELVSRHPFLGTLTAANLLNLSSISNNTIWSRHCQALFCI